MISEWLRPPPGTTMLTVNLLGPEVPYKEHAHDADLYMLDVPEPEWRACMARAAKHKGYTPTSGRARRFVMRDLEMWEPWEDAGPGEVTSRELVRCVGSQHGLGRLLHCHWAIAKRPLTAFPCGSEEAAHGVVDVSWLSLRVHKRACLIFESIQNPVTPVNPVNPMNPMNPVNTLHTLRLEVDLLAIKNSRERPDQAHNTLEDVQRTVENTITVVMLGAPPLRRAGGPRHPTLSVAPTLRGPPGLHRSPGGAAGAAPCAAGTRRPAERRDEAVPGLRAQASAPQ